MTDSGPTKFGLLYSLQAHPTKWGGPSSRQQMSAVPEMAAHAESVGFDSIWFTEHHMSEHNEGPSPLIMMAAAAARTSKVTIGPLVLLAPFYHPVKLAEDMAVLDNISGGRMVLGIGLGYRPHEFAGVGLDISDRVPYFKETVEIVSRCFDASQDGFSYKGRFFDLDNVRIRPRPVQEPLPIWLGAIRRKALERCARFGYPVPIGLTPLPLLRVQRRNYAEALVAEGKDRSTIQWPILREAFCAETDEKAWEVGSRYLFNLYRDDYRPHEVVPVFEDDGTYRFATSADDPVFSRGLDHWRERAFIGSPETIVSEVLRHDALVPGTHYIFRVQMAGMPPEVAMESVELFGTRVLPELRRRLPEQQARLFPDGFVQGELANEDPFPVHAPVSAGAAG